jgi:pteridine reductase
MTGDSAATALGSGGRPVAVVTGAVRRVGLATARALAGAGCDVVITYRRSAEAAARAAEEIGHAAGPDGRAARVEALRLDLEDLAGVESFAAAAAARLGRVDVLVHNASMYAPTPLERVTGEELLRYYRVNAAAPLLLSRGLAGALSRSRLAGGGAIVCLCDVHALGEHGLPRRGFAAYSMSKAALAEVVRTLAREMAGPPTRVRVNGVAPGVVAFPEEGYESDAAAQEEYLRRVPLGRAGTPEEAAAVVRWLALEATYVTGEIVRVDGGRGMV